MVWNACVEKKVDVTWSVSSRIEEEVESHSREEEYLHNPARNCQNWRRLESKKFNTQRAENAVIWQTGYELNGTTGIVEPAQEIQIEFMRMEQ
jgi:hypothetical protein